eukprot:4036035-Amphidinium_carterae.1
MSDDVTACADVLSLDIHPILAPQEVSALFAWQLMGGVLAVKYCLVYELKNAPLEPAAVAKEKASRQTVVEVTLGSVRGGFVLHRQSPLRVSRAWHASLVLQSLVLCFDEDVAQASVRGVRRAATMDIIPSAEQNGSLEAHSVNRAIIFFKLLALGVSFFLHNKASS